MGTLMEIFKSYSIGQITSMTILPGQTVDGHLHKETNEKWFVFGEASIKLEFQDGMRELICTSGPPSKVINVPAGTGHEITNIGETDLVLIFHSDRIYDSDKPDKEPWEWT